MFDLKTGFSQTLILLKRKLFIPFSVHDTGKYIQQLYELVLFKGNVVNHLCLAQSA